MSPWNSHNILYGNKSILQGWDSIAFISSSRIPNTKTLRTIECLFHLHTSNRTQLKLTSHTLFLLWDISFSFIFSEYIADVACQFNWKSYIILVVLTVFVHWNCRFQQFWWFFSMNHKCVGKLEAGSYQFHFEGWKYYFPSDRGPGCSQQSIPFLFIFSLLPTDFNIPNSNAQSTIIFYLIILCVFLFSWTVSSLGIQFLCSSFLRNLHNSAADRYPTNPHWMDRYTSLGRNVSLSLI